MQTKTKILPPELLLEEFRTLLWSDDRIESLPLVITGGSMSPFLISSRDTVHLSRPTRPLRRGDAVLYQRKGRNISPGNFWWDFFEKVWIRMIPLRRPLCHIYTNIRRFTDKR